MPRFVLPLLALAGFVLFGHGAYIHAKALLALRCADGRTGALRFARHHDWAGFLICIGAREPFEIVSVPWDARGRPREIESANDEFPGPLPADDAGIVLDPGDLVCRADHPDPAPHPALCLYAPWHRARGGIAAAVWLADSQLFQHSDHGPAG